MKILFTPELQNTLKKFPPKTFLFLPIELRNGLERWVTKIKK